MTGGWYRKVAIPPQARPRQGERGVSGLAARCRGEMLGKCKASRGVTAFERRQCRKNSVVLFFEESTDPDIIPIQTNKIDDGKKFHDRQKFRESFDSSRPRVPKTRRNEGMGRRRKKWDLRYKAMSLYIKA